MAPTAMDETIKDHIKLEVVRLSGAPLKVFFLSGKKWP